MYFREENGRLIMWRPFGDPDRRQFVEYEHER
jgi:hypothetical protein